jgi:hypothetical protein
MCIGRKTRLIAVTGLTAIFSTAFLPAQAADTRAEPERLAAVVPGSPGGSGTPAPPPPAPPPAAGPSADICHPDNNRGLIKDVIVNANGIYFYLRGTPYDVKGIKWREGGYYILERTQPGFDTFADYVLGAATAKCYVKVKCKPIPSSPSARVEYFVLDNSIDNCGASFP